MGRNRQLSHPVQVQCLCLNFLTSWVVRVRTDIHDLIVHVSGIALIKKRDI